VHTITIGLLGSAALSGLLRFDGRRIGRYVVVTVLLTAGTFGGLRVLFATSMRPSFQGAELVRSMRPLLPEVPATRLPSPPDLTEDTGPVLAGIASRGAVRVGVLSERVPYAYEDRQGRLVGLDIEMAHQLARDLRVRLEFVPLAVEAMPDAVARGACDIVMSGVVATPQRAAEIRFSEPYLDETLAFVVPDYLREDYGTWDGIRARGAVTIGAPNLPYFMAALQERLPEARLKPIPIDRDVFASTLPYEAVMLSGERGAVVTLLHPEYSVVVPAPDIVRVPLAYPIARHDENWAAFVNMWIEFKRRDGTIEKLKDHWVYGKDALRAQPRWSVVRNVLHWVE
jgi:ABC-type amino acid transport substrate-binding protein